jgi:hypothetical protein
MAKCGVNMKVNYNNTRQLIVQGFTDAIPSPEDGHRFANYFTQWLSTIHAIERATGFVLEEDIRRVYNKRQEARKNNKTMNKLQYPNESIYNNLAYEIIGLVDYDIQKSYDDDCCEEGPERALELREKIGQDIQQLLIEYRIIEPSN